MEVSYRVQKYKIFCKKTPIWRQNRKKNTNFAANFSIKRKQT